MRVNKKNLLRLSLAAALIYIIFPNTAAQAQLDPRCFSQAECIEARQGLGITDKREAREGWYNKSDSKAICGTNPFEPEEELGFCLPSTKTITQIGFGGQRQFNNIGEFIQLIYRYGIIIGGILATIIIIVSGIRWTMSGGNAERVKAAQKMIGGAIMGIIILSISFTLLNILNPATVNLRLPQVWLIKQQDVSPFYCSDVDKNTALAQIPAADIDKNLSTENLRKSVENAFKAADEADKQGDKTNGTQTSETAPCGKKYYLGDTGASCLGAICPNEKEICIQDLRNSENITYKCEVGNIVGFVKNSSVSRELSQLITEDWEYPWVDEGETELWGLCNDGERFEFAVDDTTTNNDTAGTQQFVIELEVADPVGYISRSDNCGNINAFKGFYLRVEMNESYDSVDEDHFIGRNGIDFGDSRRFLERQPSIKNTELYSLEELLSPTGIHITIDAASIKDYD